MLKFGIISEVNYSKGLARVNYDDINIVSGWLSLPSNSTKGIKNCVRLPINTQVAVLQHHDGEQGVIISALWSQVDTPPTWADDKTDGIEYDDGDKFLHKSDSHIFEFNGGTLGGLVILAKLVNNLNSLKSYCETLKSAISTGLNSVGEGGAASGTAAKASFESAMTAQNISFENMENEKIKQ